MVNVLGCRDDQCIKYATLTTSAEKLSKHGKRVCAPIISRLNEQVFNGPGMRGVQEENN
jgi:predicted transcriptional regulator